MEVVTGRLLLLLSLLRGGVLRRCRVDRGDLALGLVGMGVPSSVAEAHGSWERRPMLGSFSADFFVMVLVGDLQSISKKGLCPRLGDDGNEIEVRLEEIWVSLDPALSAEV
jgi:hypothetical protein